MTEKFNCLTTRNDQDVNSPHNSSQVSIENEVNYQLKRCEFDITPNSYDYSTKKPIVLIRRMNVLILGMKG